MRRCHVLFFFILLAYPLASHAQKERISARIDSLQSLANQFRLHDVATAITAVEQAQTLALENKLYMHACKGYNQLGSIYLNIGFYTKSLENFHKALALSKEKSWLDFEAQALTNIGNVYYFEDSLKHALAYYQQSLKLSTRSHNLKLEARNLGNIGMVHSHMANYTQAKEYLEKSLLISRELKLMEGTCLNLLNLADLYYRQNQHDSAQYHFKNALALAEKIRYTQGKIYTQMGLAKVYSTLQDNEEANNLLQAALALSRQVTDNNATKTILTQLSGLSAQNGNYKQALSYQREYSKLSDSLSMLAQHSEQQHYFNLLEAERNINENRLLKANVAARDLELKASLANHQKQLAITFASVIAVIMLIGIMVFLLYHYHQSKRNHDRLQQMHAAIQAQAKELEEAYDKIRQHNIELEGNIQERTRQLNQQNRQLIQYAFFNAHKVRGPLARILGLVNLLPKAEHQTEFHFILDRLNESAHELDKVVHEINVILESKTVSQDNFN
ncbi:tetratricopeptide repeat protein [Cesiribacter sp. SM1]|uniref:tetratricopeptide repeat protein n=1 Tax=Cesiribacter sp. SM1 TaxID=2861196 RepID=UPI001CD3509F|nr:tetratricopeptide repeat protein [Cesiribacter sp. SM1]